MTIPTSLLAPEGVSFEDAIALTQTLISEMDAGKLSETETQEAIASLVKTRNGARGFFVGYLTDERPLADCPSPAVLAALQSSPEVVPELLVKNVAMSSAMVVHHRRNQDEVMATSSMRVRSRATNLIQQLKMPACHTLAQQMREGATTGEGAFQDFFQRWRYDEEQKTAMAEALQPLSQ